MTDPGATFSKAGLIFALNEARTAAKDLFKIGQVNVGFLRISRQMLSRHRESRASGELTVNHPGRLRSESSNHVHLSCHVAGATRACCPRGRAVAPIGG